MEGSYGEIAFFGQEGSEHRKEKLKEFKNQKAFNKHCETFGYSFFSGSQPHLMAWYTWIDSWLRRAGDRKSDPIDYI